LGGADAFFNIFFGASSSDSESDPNRPDASALTLLDACATEISYEVMGS
jgi:hypothetical protein